jgi:hypothetical protein
VADQSLLSLVVEADLKSLVCGTATLAILIHAPDQNPSDQVKWEVRLQSSICASTKIYLDFT